MRRAEARLPGAFDRSVADADAFFGQELPALQKWSFTAGDASRIAAEFFARDPRPAAV